MRVAQRFGGMDHIRYANESYCWQVRRPSFSNQWCKVQ